MSEPHRDSALARVLEPPVSDKLRERVSHLRLRETQRIEAMTLNKKPAEAGHARSVGMLAPRTVMLDKHPMQENNFEFQKWPVYEKALDFVVQAYRLCGEMPKDGTRSISDQFS